MPRSPELLRRYSLLLLAHAQELRQVAAAARERAAKCKEMAETAGEAREVADVLRQRLRTGVTTGPVLNTRVRSRRVA
jgi:hypothetical protein